MSCISHESGYTDFFKILTGVPQGDPLSGLIFILAIEIPLIKLNNCANLKLDLKLCNNIPIQEIEGYADDLLTFIPTTNDALLDLKYILTDFTRLSGLELNCEKTEVNWFQSCWKCTFFTREIHLSEMQTVMSISACHVGQFLAGGDVLSH